MTITAAPRTPAAVRVTPDLTWTPRNAWGTTSTHVDGDLSDGSRLAVATYGDHDLGGLGLRADATHEWLHYGLLVIEPQDGVPALVVPVDRLTEAVITEAVRRWLLARRRPQHAVAS